MLKSKLFLASLLVLSSAAGCSMAPLKARVDLLEKELDDQRSSYGRLERRLDEMQIQLALIKRKLNDGNRSSVEKLSPAEDGPNPEQYRISRPKRRQWKLHQIKVKAVDPSKVTERLSVDHDAAKRSLDGQGISLERDSSASRSTNPKQKFKPDEDKLGLNAFNEGFSLYRSNRFAKAADALEEFGERFSEHEMASSGLYYAGKSRMMIGQFKEAASIFKRLVRLYPKDERNAKALLLAGRCEERLGKSRDARGTYLELVDAFPLSQEAITANKRLKSIR